MFFRKNNINNKIDRLNSIWDDAANAVSKEIENEVFALCTEIIKSDNTNKDVKAKLAACYYLGIGCNEDTAIAKQLFFGDR